MDVFDKVEAKYGAFGVIALMACGILTFLIAMMTWVALTIYYPIVGLAIPPAIAAFILLGAHKNDEDA